MNQKATPKDLQETTLNGIKAMMEELDPQALHTDQDQHHLTQIILALLELQLGTQSSDADINALYKILNSIKVTLYERLFT